MHTAAGDPDWSDRVSCYLPQIVGPCELAGQLDLIKKVRLVCKAWLSAANDARRIWHPQNRCTDDSICYIVRSFVNLTHVDLSSLHPRSPVDLQPILVSLKSLETLHTGNFGISVPSGVSQALERLCNLRSLDLCPVGDLALFRLQQLQQLAMLCVRGPEIYTWREGPPGDCYDNEDTAMHALEKAAALTCLKTLSLQRLAMNKAAWRALARLSQLEKLSLIEVDHTDHLLWSDLDARPSVTSLAMASIDAFAAVCKLVQLAELNIPGSLVYLPSITTAGNLTGLTRLDMQGVESISSLQGLERLAGLAWLDVSDLTRISTLAPLQQLTNLCELRFASCINLLTSGVQVLSSLKSLQLLDMHCCAFSSSWITLLTGLTALHDLDMSVGNWRDQDVVQLTTCIHLTRLALRECPSTTASMHRILKERLPMLEQLEAACSVTGEQFAGFLGWPY